VVTGISEHKILEINSNQKQDKLLTPGRRRPNQKCPVMSQFDSFRVDHVKRLVQSFYDRNDPPLIENVFEKLKQEIQGEEEALRRQGITPKPFKCSTRSFRRFIKSIGFKYGNINMRDVILMRDDIVSKRFKYIEALRTNRNSDNPLPIIYTGWLVERV